MTAAAAHNRLEFFCSYSHVDSSYRVDMETGLALLTHGGTAHLWTDQEILSGDSLSKDIYEQMDRTDIFVFLLSPNFLSSQACIDEWEYAWIRASEGHPIKRVPIIVRECAWKEFLAKYDDDPLVLPNDGKPVSAWADKDTAWYQVYLGIARVVDEMSSRHEPKSEFRQSLNTTDFIADRNIELEDIYVFPRLISTNIAEAGQRRSNAVVVDEKDLLALDFVLIHGPEKSGKTSLASHIYMRLVENQRPVLLLTPPPAGKQLQRFISDEFSQQYTGEFSDWLKLPDKTVVIDNIPESNRGIRLLEIAREWFDRILLVIPTETYLKMFFDDARITDFSRFEIAPLSLRQQETLIRRRLSLSADARPLTDGYVDQVGNEINAIIISDRIVPRYPFYVLSILQTQESYMPSSMAITSYAHCYFALILAKLIQAGVSNADDEINACFNFAGHLAYAIYKHRQSEVVQDFDFASFLDDYNARYIIRDTLINRLKHAEFGIINERGTFRNEYIYYFMLGKYLASNRNATDPIIAELCTSSHQEEMRLTLLFTIHHTEDLQIIDDVLANTRAILEGVDAATLSRDETKRFTDILAQLPETVLSSDPVATNRNQLLDVQDQFAELEISAEDIESQELDTATENALAEIGRFFGNSGILGQVLRTKHGNLEIRKIEEIIETIVDAGLRLVAMSLLNQQQVEEIRDHVQSALPDLNTDDINQTLDTLMFLWVCGNLNHISTTINVKEIHTLFIRIIARHDTPAYDLVGFLCALDSAEELNERLRNDLRKMLADHDDVFARRVLSLATQTYMNTHQSAVHIERSVCDLLGIQYEARNIRLD